MQPADLAPPAGDAPSDRARWRCPECGRTFPRRSQPHSCKRVPVEARFASKGTARSLFDALRAAVEERVGPCELVSLPCCIHLTSTDDFLAVLPKRDRLEVRFTLHRRIEASRITACTQTSHTAYKHSIDVTELEAIDDELLGWVDEACHLRDG
jgi:hypothetical protein